MAGMLGLPLPAHSIAWGDYGICVRQNRFKMLADNLTLGLSKCRRVEQTVSLELWYHNGRHQNGKAKSAACLIRTIGVTRMSMVFPPASGGNLPWPR